MSDEIRLHETPSETERPRLRSWIWIGPALLGMVLLLRPTVYTAILPHLTSNTPDTVQILAVTPNGGLNGQFTIRLRLRRADGAPLSAGIMTTADLLDAGSDTQFLGRQSGFQIARGPNYRWMDLTLFGKQPPDMKSPRRVTAQVRVQIMAPVESLQLLAWEWSRRKLRATNVKGSPWKTLSQEVILPPLPTSPTDPE